MIKKTPSQFWFPFWVDKWIFGSMRIEFMPEERALWVDLLALAAKDDGFIRANENTPYSVRQLAGMLVYDEEFFSKTIEKFVEKKKLSRDKNNVLYICQWEKYSTSPSYKRVLKYRTLSKEKTTNEEAIKEGIKEYLNSKNIAYEIEKKCSTGRLDFFIPGNPNSIIEVKSNITDILPGIRQLLGYKTEFPNSILYLAFYGQLTEEINEKLKKQNIKVWDCNTKCYGVTEGVTHNITEQNITEQNIKDIISQIISYLNEKTEKKFSSKSENTIKLISGRLKEGRTLNDFKQVIDIKVMKWRGDPKMDDYLRPDTLFRPSNFESYLNEQPIKPPIGQNIKPPSSKEEKYKKAKAEFIKKHGEDKDKLAEFSQKWWTR